MNIQNKINDFILNLQDLPENKKKIIFFAVMAISVIMAVIFAIKFTQYSLPAIENSLKKMPSVELNEDLSNNPLIDDVNSSGDVTNNYGSEDLPDEASQPNQNNQTGIIIIDKGDRRISSENSNQDYENSLQNP